MNTIRRESAIPLASSFAAICLGSLTMSMFPHGAAAGTLVVVPPGFEETEGNSRHWYAPHPEETLVLQEIYPASEFLGVPAGATQIVGMKYRPDGDIFQPRVVSPMTFELRLSTSDAVPGTLDPVLDNVRGDDEVIVYQGTLNFATDALGPAGGPHSFDYVVDFQTPFSYHPSSGRTLVIEETVTIHGEIAPYVDDHEFRGIIRRNFARPPFVEATVQSDDATIRQFEFVPEPIGDFDGDGDVDGFDFIAWQQNPSLGNLSDWQANYGLPITASSAAVPAPASITLALVFVGLSAARRHR